MRYLLAVTLMMLILPSVASATDYYVAKDGSGDFSTIQAAANVAQAGDTVYVKAGTYDEGISLQRSGSINSYITFRNHGDDEVAIDASGKSKGISLADGVRYVRIIGLEIKNANDYGIAGCDYCDNNNIEIRDCEIHHNGDSGEREGGIRFSGGTLNHITIDNCEVHHNHARGISIGYGSDIIVSNNFVYRNPDEVSSYMDLYEMYFLEVSDSIVKNNVVYFAGKSVRFHETCSNNLVYYNIFAYSGEAGLEFNNYQGSLSDGNVVRNNIFAFNNVYGINFKHWTKDNDCYHNVFYAGGGWIDIMQNQNGDKTGFQNNIFYVGLTGVQAESGSWSQHDYNNYYSIEIPGVSEPNSVNVEPQFDDADRFDFDTNNPAFKNTGNNPDGYGDMIGLSSNFVEDIPPERIFPNIPLSVHSASYDTTGASKTIDRKSGIYDSRYAWASDQSSGWIIYDCGETRDLKYIGLFGSGSTSYYSPKNFRIAVSTTGTQDSDFSTVLDAIYVMKNSQYGCEISQWFEIGSAVQARYIKLMIDNSQADSPSASNPDVSVQEFYAIGPGGTGEPAYECGDGECSDSETCQDDSCCNGNPYDTNTQVCCSEAILPGECCTDSDCNLPETCDENHICTEPPQTCQSMDYRCCSSCQSGPQPEFDSDCDPYVCCESCSEEDPLVLHMRLDEGSGTAASDESTYQNDGTISGAKWVDGRHGQALEFDGNSYLEIDDSPSLDLTSEATLSAWIYPYSASAWSRVVAKSHTADASPWTMYGLLFDDSGHIRMEIATDGVQNIASGQNIIPLNEWTFVAGTYDGSSMKVFVDGELDDTAPHSGHIDTNDMPLSLGRSGFGSDYFSGMIDEIRVYNTALSAQDILDIYNQDDYHDADTSEPYGCVTMDELTAYIELWLTGQEGVTMPDMMGAVNLWRAGTGC